MIQEPFLICENPESMQGPGLVISTAPPFWIGKVIQVKDIEQADRFTRMSQNSISYGKVVGYRIYIEVFTKLFRQIVDKPTQVEYVGQLQWMPRQMAEFYLQNKILKNAGYYKRYKEQ